MDNLKGNEFLRRSLRIGNGLNSNVPMKPLGVCNSQSSYDRKSLYSSLQKSPIDVRKTLFETNSKENDDFALCKGFNCDRESTGKSPVLVVTKQSSNSQDKKKIMPRRSMLGLRSKNQLTNFVKDDTTYTLSKPLQASSPNSIDRENNYNHADLNSKPLSQRSVSTPQLTPFDSDVDTSSFFNKGISDSTWSVFKSVKKKSTYATRASVIAEKSRPQRKSLVSSVDQEIKLKWLSQKFQMEGKNLLPNKNDYSRKNEYKESSAEEYSSDNEENKNLEKEESQQDKLKYISPIKITNCTDEDDTFESSPNSTDSYIQNETTILNSEKNNLEKIDEESINQSYNNSMPDEDYIDVPDSNETATINIDRLMNLFEDLKNEKEDMDYKLGAFLKQREVFEEKWNDFLSVLGNCREKSSNNSSINFNFGQRKPKKVISTKVRHSFVVSPKVCLTLPKSSKMSSYKTSSNPKINIISCKTPVNSEKKLNRFKKCYTPNTLSNMVDNQAKDIFGDM